MVDFRSAALENWELDDDNESKNSVISRPRVVLFHRVTLVSWEHFMRASKATMQTASARFLLLRLAVGYRSLLSLDQLTARFLLQPSPFAAERGRRLKVSRLRVVAPRLNVKREPASASPRWIAFFQLPSLRSKKDTKVELWLISMPRVECMVFMVTWNCLCVDVVSICVSSEVKKGEFIHN